jgi:polar amino acid transport system substrate-binding protein
MDKGYFTYGLEAQYRPFEFRDENNQIVGFDIDLANELAKRWDVEARPVDTNWATVIQTLYDGGFDFILGGMTATQERYERVNFSVPYMDASSGLLVKAGDGIKAREDLDGKVVGAGVGTPSIKQLELSANELKIAYDGEIKTYDDDAAAYEALKVKRIDVYASTLVSLLEFANQTPGFEVLPFRSKLWPAEYTSAAFRKEDEALRQKFDASILEMKQDGTLAEMQQKWFNRTFEPLPDTAPTW